MRATLLFLHLLGVSAWLGGGLALMLGGITAKGFGPTERLAVYRILAVVGRNLVGTGAVLVVVTGLGLIGPYMSSGVMPGSLSAMMGFGLVGALIAIFVVTPTAARLGRLQVDPRGELPEAFADLRKRQAIFATIAGVCALAALVSGAMLRY